jgi:3D (Asp-Asp-Asp) domain-containing protein
VITLQKKLFGAVAIILLLVSTCLADTIYKCRITSYNPTVAQCGKSNGMTASGVKGQTGMVAADWRTFPAGSILYCLETKELWVVADRGGAIHGARIDRFVPKMSQNKYYSSGKLTIMVIHKAPRGAKLAAINVRRGVMMRLWLLNRRTELASRGGFDRLRGEVANRVSKQKIKRSCRKMTEENKNPVPEVNEATKNITLSLTSAELLMLRSSIAALGIKNKDAVFLKLKIQDAILDVLM